MRKNKAVSRRKLTRRAVIVLACGAYFLGICLGAAITVAIPLFNHKTDLEELAENRGQYTLYNYTDYPEPTFGTEYYLFDTESRIITEDVLFLSEQSQQKLRGCLPELYEKGKLYKPMMLSLTSTTEKRCLCIIAGKVVTGRTGLRFGSVIVRDLTDIDISIETFAALYTVVFAAAGVLVLSIIREHRELTNMQRDLVANVSHELKTPITSIKAMAELIHDGMDKGPEDRKRYSAAILRESDRLKELVGEIMELAGLQSHKVDLKKYPTYADGVFTPVVDRFMMMCGDLGVTLNTDGLALEKIPQLYTDPKYIVKVMNILLENAIKFTGKGGTVWLSQELSTHYVVFCVRDNGPGIEQKDIDHIFDRFYKADVTHNSQGSGLGLSIASEIAKGLGERIWVKSVPGTGSSFYFTVGYK